jgi:alpha-D-ribose 1-methylphosphonate 5-triphosphate synthase subunit PhnL
LRDTLLQGHSLNAKVHTENIAMTKYLVSFPGLVMDVPTEEMAAVSESVHSVIREAKIAGVYVFGGGINEEVAPLMVAANGRGMAATCQAPDWTSRETACIECPMMYSGLVLF